MENCPQCGKMVKELVFNQNVCVECVEYFSKWAEDSANAMRNSQKEWKQEEIGNITATVGAVTGVSALDKDAVIKFPRTERKFVTPNKMTTPPRSWQPHHFRHLLTGSIVFALGVAAHIALDEIKYRWPCDVRWADGSVQHGFQRGPTVLTTNLVMIGVTDDGSLVWREITNK